MTRTSPKAKRVVKAWVVCDGQDKAIYAQSGVGRALTGLLFIYRSKAEAEDAWRGMHIHPISFHLPSKKRGTK